MWSLHMCKAGRGGSCLVSACVQGREGRGCVVSACVQGRKGGGCVVSACVQGREGGSCVVSACPPPHYASACPLARMQRAYESLQGAHEPPPPTRSPCFTCRELTSLTGLQVVCLEDNPVTDPEHAGTRGGAGWVADWLAKKKAKLRLAGLAATAGAAGLGPEPSRVGLGPEQSRAAAGGPGGGMGEVGEAPGGLAAKRSMSIAGPGLHALTGSGVE